MLMGNMEVRCRSLPIDFKALRAKPHRRWFDLYEDVNCAPPASRVAGEAGWVFLVGMRKCRTGRLHLCLVAGDGNCVQSISGR